MKRKWNKVIDAVLDGELTAEQGRRLLEQLGAGDEAEQRLKKMIELAGGLESLPAEKPTVSLGEGVLTTIRRRQHLGGPGKSKASVRLALVAAGALAGVAMAATVAVPLLRSRRLPVPRHIDQGIPCRARQVIGKVELDRGTQVAMLLPGQKLSVPDVIRTAENARAEIDIDRDARMLLHRQSNLRVSRLERQLRVFTLGGGRVTVEMLDGGRRSVRLLVGRDELSAEGRRGSFALLALADGRTAVAALRHEVVVGCRGRYELPAGWMLKLSSGCSLRKKLPVPEGVKLEVKEPDGGFRPGRLKITGSTDSHARLWLNGRLLDTSPDGSFTVKIEVARGDIIEIVAVDVVGNTNTVELGPSRVDGEKKASRSPARRVRTKSYRVTW